MLYLETPMGYWIASQFVLLVGAYHLSVWLWYIWFWKATTLYRILKPDTSFPYLSSQCCVSETETIRQSQPSSQDSNKHLQSAHNGGPFIGDNFQEKYSHETSKFWFHYILSCRALQRRQCVLIHQPRDCLFSIKGNIKPPMDSPKNSNAEIFPCHDVIMDTLVKIWCYCGVLLKKYCCQLPVPPVTTLFSSWHLLEEFTNDQWFPSQRASDAQSVFTSWRRHGSDLFRRSYWFTGELCRSARTIIKPVPHNPALAILFSDRYPARLLESVNKTTAVPLQ